MKKILQTDKAATTILIRLMVGAVFLSEGIQKFLFAEELGSGRFKKIGLPNQDFLGPFVGTFEIVCGLLVLIGLFTRWPERLLVPNIYFIWDRIKTIEQTTVFLRCAKSLLDSINW